MARAPAWRLARDAYPFGCPLQTRYRDQDILAHINNTALAGYYDEGREQFMRAVFSRVPDPVRPRIVTAEIGVSFLGEVFHPDTVEIACGVLKIGTASFEIGQALFQKGRCVGLASATFVQTDEHGASPLGDGLRAALEGLRVREG